MTPLSALLNYHIATTARPLPHAAPGITWIWAADGIYKRGQDAVCTVLAHVGLAAPVPGLAELMPGVTWHAYPRRLPGQLLAAMLAHARKAAVPNGGGVLRPIEQQYHVVLEAQRLRVRVPLQAASPGRVRYQMPAGAVLLDLHSHHGMPAYFSATDDRDDTGLGVSAVVGRIFDRPEIAVRLCCYGHTQRIPAFSIFDSLPGCRDTYEDDHAATRH
jgi:PRTRC genetic system protein A